MVERGWWVGRGGTTSAKQGVVVRHPVQLGLAPPGGAEAKQAGGDDAELQEDDGSTGSYDDGPGRADNLPILVITPDKY